MEVEKSTSTNLAGSKEGDGSWTAGLGCLLKNEIRPLRKDGVEAEGEATAAATVDKLSRELLRCFRCLPGFSFDSREGLEGRWRAE